MSRTASDLTNEEIELVEQLSDVANENYVYRDVNGDFIGVPWGGGGGSGDVNWPVSSINNNFASFNGTDGKTIQDSGYNASSFLVANATITGATKTKITYDAKGLVTAGADATTADIADSTNKRYVTDANLTTIGNQSGTNTGDNAVNSLYSGLAASKENVSNKATDFTVVNNTLYPTVQAAKDYTDTVAQGLTTKQSARLATTTTLPANTYSNGSSGVGATLTATSNGILTIDSGNVVLNDYILVKDQASQLQNGLYKCTTAGTAGVPYVLTRAVEMNTTLEFSGSYVFVFDGVINENAGFVCTNNTPPTVGTTAIVFVQFSGAGQVIAGNGLSKSANTLSINTAITADLSTAQNLTNKTVTSPTLVTPSAFTTGGTITLAENTSIALDPAGSADWKYSGITMTGTGGATIAFGDLVTLDKDDSRWELVDISVAAAATGDARGIIGIAVTSSTDGNPITVLLQGIIRADSNFPPLTIGAAVYASTAGDIVVTQPTTTDYVIKIVWFALTNDEIYFHPSNDWITST